ncbi:hypothetical protein LTR36_004777 [Oleoguttula mirabilis]|uniref:Uncharacterized protein n=1 Tax=Oleoguttula mirabilis TaxID=1507867 RepID=A0AAV9JGQ9_9PEZI|nr:hypothetical protein LTR36_004777 [Oleoguttula mirabilis]
MPPLIADQRAERKRHERDKRSRKRVATRKAVAAKIIQDEEALQKARKGQFDARKFTGVVIGRQKFYIAGSEQNTRAIFAVQPDSHKGASRFTTLKNVKINRNMDDMMPLLQRKKDISNALGVAEGAVVEFVQMHRINGLQPDAGQAFAAFNNASANEGKDLLRRLRLVYGDTTFLSLEALSLAATSLLAIRQPQLPGWFTGDTSSFDIYLYLFIFAIYRPRGRGPSRRMLTGIPIDDNQPPVPLQQDAFTQAKELNINRAVITTRSQLRRLASVTPISNAVLKEPVPAAEAVSTPNLGAAKRHGYINKHYQEHFEEDNEEFGEAKQQAQEQFEEDNEYFDEAKKQTLVKYDAYDEYSTSESQTIERRESIERAHPVKRSPNKLRKIKPSTPHSPLLGRGLSLLSRVRERFKRSKSTPQVSGLGIAIPGAETEERVLEVLDSKQAVAQRPEPPRQSSSSTELHCISTTASGHRITTRSPKVPVQRTLKALRVSPSPSSSESGSKGSSGRKSGAAGSSTAATEQAQAAAHEEVGSGLFPITQTATAQTFAAEGLAAPGALAGEAEHSYSLIGAAPGDDRLGLPSQIHLDGVTQAECSADGLQDAVARRSAANPNIMTESGALTGPVASSSGHDRRPDDRAEEDAVARQDRNLMACGPACEPAHGESQDSQPLATAGDVPAPLRVPDRSSSTAERYPGPQKGEAYVPYVQEGHELAAGIPTHPVTSHKGRPDSIAEGEALAQESEKYVPYIPEGRVVPRPEYEYEVHSGQAHCHIANAPEDTELPRPEPPEGQLPRLKPYGPEASEEPISELLEALLERYVAYSPSRYGDRNARPRRPRQNS